MAIKILEGVTAVAALVAAGFWFSASMVTVTDNIDMIVGELQRIGRLNTIAAFSTGVAAICSAILTGVGRAQRRRDSRDAPPAHDQGPAGAG